MQIVTKIYDLYNYIPSNIGNNDDNHETVNIIYLKFINVIIIYVVRKKCI